MGVTHLPVKSFKLQRKTHSKKIPKPTPKQTTPSLPPEDLISCYYNEHLRLL